VVILRLEWVGAVRWRGRRREVRRAESSVVERGGGGGVNQEGVKKKRNELRKKVKATEVRRVEGRCWSSLSSSSFLLHPIAFS
jgi:hypothetical protein